MSKPTPGEAIKAHLEKREMIQAELARLIDLYTPEINKLISGKRNITAEIAVCLAAAFPDTTPEYWLDLETSRQLSLVQQNPDVLKKRIRLFDFAPIREMEKRGWIPKTDDDPNKLEFELCKFFGVTSLNDDPPFIADARKTNPELPLNKIQRTWCARAKQIASILHVEKFNPEKIDEMFTKLRRLAAYPKEVIYVSDLLRQYGIRFVIVSPLEKSNIDGAAFWLSPDSPVVALSLRFDRIDAFWFTLFHELMHIKYNDAASIDSELTGEKQMPSRMKPVLECRADESASATLIDPKDMESFIARYAPLYSKTRVIQFAHTIKIHPGIIVGQLQHRAEIGYGSLRELLANIRDLVISTTVTDGWNKIISPSTLN